jgi:hypothetical protein
MTMQLHAFKQAVFALRAGNTNAFGYWYFATIVAFGAGGECVHSRDRLWRALHYWARK